MEPLPEKITIAKKYEPAMPAPTDADIERERTSKLEREAEDATNAVWVRLDELHTILSDSAAQTDRAAPVAGGFHEWARPGVKWWESFTDCVDRQVRNADEKRG